MKYMEKKIIKYVIKIFWKIRLGFGYTNIKYKYWKVKQFILKFHKKIYIILLIFICVGALLVLVYLYLEEKIKLQEFITDTMLFISAIIVLFYVVETHRLRKEADKQNRMAIHPLLMIFFKGNHLQVKNIGNGIAFNPKIDNQKMPDDNEFNYWYQYKTNKPLFLPGEEGLITIQYVKFTKKKEQNIEPGKMQKPIMGIGTELYDLSQHKYFHENNFPIMIHYKDIEKNLHYSEIIVNLGQRRSVILYDFR